MQAIPLVGRLSKGYDTGQVETFLGEVEHTRPGRPERGVPMTAADIRRVGFTLVRGGYDVAVVDTLLDDLEEAAVAAEAGAPLAATPSAAGRPAGEGAAPDHLADVVAAPAGSRVPMAGRFERGYAPAAVDPFLDSLAAFVAEGRGGLTAHDVRTVTFRAKRGGYSEEHVDDLLDQVVDHLLRTRTS